MIRSLSIAVLLTSLLQISFASDIELVVQRGHAAPVKMSCFSADGSYLASIDQNNNIIVWYMKTGSELVRFKDEIEVTSCFIGADNSRLYATNGKGQLRIWNLKNSELVQTVELGYVVNKTFEISDHETLMLSDKLYSFDLEKKTSKLVLNETIKDVSYLEKDKLLLNTSKGELIQWDISNSKEIGRKMGPKKMIKSLPDNVCYSDKFGFIIYHHKSIVTVLNQEKETVRYRISNDYPDIPISAVTYSDKNDLLLIGTQDAKVIIYDLKKGRRLKRLTAHLGAINSILFSPDEQTFVTGSSDYSLILWDSKTFKPIRRMYARAFPLNSIDVNAAGNRFVVANRIGFVKMIDFSRQRLELMSYKNHFAGANIVRFHPSGKYFVSGGSDRYLAYIDIEHPDQSRKIEIFKEHEDEILDFTDVKEPRFQDLGTRQIRAIDFSSDGKKMIVSGKNMWLNMGDQRQSVYCFSTDDLKLEYTVEANLHDIEFLSFNPVSHEFLSTNDLTVMSWNYDANGVRKTGEYWKIDRDTNVAYFQSEHYKKHYVQDYHWRLQVFSPSRIVWKDSNTFIYSNKSSLIIVNSKTGQCDSINLGHTVNSMALATEEMVALNDLDKIRFYDLRKNEFLEQELIGHTDTISDMKFVPNRPLLVSCAFDGTIKIWNYTTFDLICTLVPIDGTKLVVFTPDGYYYSTKNAISALGFKKGNLIYPAEQFDLKFNRPDIVLERIGYTDQNLINAYHWAYLKRIKKMGFTEEMFSDEFDLPQIRILDKASIPAVTEQNKLDLEIELKDEQFNLDRINVWINDVAVFGTDGISVKSKNAKSLNYPLQLNLSKGKNKIQISAINQAGIEGFKESIEIDCSVGKAQPNLYLLTIGISNYQDNRFDLTYPSKDATDIVEAFQQSKFYGEVKSKTLINEEVVLENLVKAKEFVSKADVNDQVIIFVAGHGVLDEAFNYYFASYDMDFLHPESRGIPYELLEGLLDGIVARRKLLFMDTCHSGEVDKDEVVHSDKKNDAESDIVFRSVGVQIEKKENQLGLENTTSFVTGLFTDLRKGTGATVISSAGGVELAIESDLWQNGLFTYCLIDGLLNKKADLNRDKKILVSELQDYIYNEVNRLSNGNQSPTSRIQNKELDYRIW